MGTLLIVATPIGNLQDITLRALEVLKSSDAVLCEDTRVTKKLLAHYGIRTPVISYHQHSGEDARGNILKLLSQGKTLALVSDAGTPGISDPGNELVAFLNYRAEGMKIIPIPGVSALTASASVAGIPMDKFLFLGFPPHKKGRKTFFERVASSDVPVILYESPFRIEKTLKELAALSSSLYVVVCRELTKQFETILRGPIEEVALRVKKNPVKGEFVLIVSKEWK